MPDTEPASGQSPEQPQRNPTQASRSFLERHQAATWTIIAIGNGLISAAWFASGDLPLAVANGAVAGLSTTVAVMASKAK